MAISENLLELVAVIARQCPQLSVPVVREIAIRLKADAKSLHPVFVNECNGYKDETKRKADEQTRRAVAIDLAEVQAALGSDVIVEIQDDPRGWPLNLLYQNGREFGVSP